MLNQVVLIGRLCKDPELRYTTGGKAVGGFRLAVDRGTATKETDFIDVVVWEKQAETASTHLRKGRLVAVQGRLQIRQFEHEGQKREKAEVVANIVKFLDRSGDNPDTIGVDVTDDDVPF